MGQGWGMPYRVGNALKDFLPPADNTKDVYTLSANTKDVRSKMMAEPGQQDGGEERGARTRRFAENERNLRRALNVK